MGSARWVPAALLALLIHGALLFGWRLPSRSDSIRRVEPGQMQFSFLEANLPAPVPPARPSVTAPEPPLPEPVSPPVETIRSAARPATPVGQAAAPKPVRSTPRARPSFTPNSVTSGIGSPPGHGTASSGTGAGKISGKPVYSVRPSPLFPPESRAAREEGVVVLRLTVNADGRPTAVVIARSSGFPKLDRAAVEAGWRCRVSNAGSGMQFEAPIRFDLGARMQ